MGWPDGAPLEAALDASSPEGGAGVGRSLVAALDRTTRTGHCRSVHGSGSGDEEVGEGRGGRFGLFVGSLGIGPLDANAACTCLDTDADGLPDIDGVCVGNQIQQVSPYPGEGPAQPAAQISVRFDRELSCGQYINGDFWVVEPSAGTGVTIAGTTPAFARTDEDSFGPRWKHGFQVDPVRIDSMLEQSPQGQSFDERAGN